MAITLPENVRGPILDLALPASAKGTDLVLRNNATGKTLRINLPAGWGGDDLSLDWFRRTITDQTGADRSSLLDPADNNLWLASEPLVAGANDVEIEALGAIESQTRSPGTLADDASIGTKTWSNPSNAAASDDSRATVALAETNLSHYLKATNYGFALTGATILGIVPGIEISRSSGISSCRIFSTNIVKGGVIQPPNLSPTLPILPESDELMTFGTASSDWGLGLTGADVSAANFGFVTSVTNLSGAPTARVDHMPLTIYFRRAKEAYAAKATLRWEQGYA